MVTQALTCLNHLTLYSHMERGGSLKARKREKRERRGERVNLSLRFHVCIFTYGARNGAATAREWSGNGAFLERENWVWPWTKKIFKLLSRSLFATGFGKFCLWPKFVFEADGT